MSTATKNLRALQASTSNAAGSTTTSSTWDLTTAFGGTMTAMVTNGATGPTVGCDFVVQVSGDNSNWKEYSRQTAGVSNSGVYSFAVEIPLGFMYARCQFTGNTGSAVTVECQGNELTSVG